MEVKQWYAWCCVVTGFVTATLGTVVLGLTVGHGLDVHPLFAAWNIGIGFLLMVLNLTGLERGWYRQ